MEWCSRSHIICYFVPLSDTFSELASEYVIFISGPLRDLYYGYMFLGLLCRHTWQMDAQVQVQFVDSARQNLAASFVNAFINAGNIPVYFTMFLFCRYQFNQVVEGFSPILDCALPFLTFLCLPVSCELLTGPAWVMHHGSLVVLPLLT